LAAEFFRFKNFPKKDKSQTQPGDAGHDVEFSSPADDVEQGDTDNKTDSGNNDVNF
jgi:hypothetical protein